MDKTSTRKVSAYVYVELLWKEGFFRDKQILRTVSENITKKWGHNFSPADISKALKKAPFLRRTGKRGNFQHIQRVSPEGRKTASVKEELFSPELIEKLGKDFDIEVKDLRLNFGNSGTCTSFLLRKMLEKLIYIAFARNGIETKLEDKNQPGSLKGLQSMIGVAASEKIDGFPFITPKTAREIKGIKFLGDSSAHNPLINVDMETIIPQIPFLIIAYKELARHL